MIRKLGVLDNQKILKLIADEPEINLYIKSDIENYGYEKDFVDYYGEFDKDGDLKAILVRYFNSFNVYAKGDYDVYSFAEIIKSFDDLSMISGRPDIIAEFDKTELVPKGIAKFQLAALKKINSNFKIADDICVKKACLSDIDRIVELRSSIKEFSIRSNLKELLKNEYIAGTAKGYYVEADGKMAAYAQTSAESSTLAMVVSVMTADEYRGRGYASAVVKKLCEDRTAEGKTLCLYYNNPIAAGIYKKIGFQDIGLWTMYKY